jgi:DNA-binding CsgD family transcriptional regulator
MKIKDLTKKEAVLLLEVIYAATQCSEETGLRDLFARLNRLVPFNMAGSMLSKEQKKAGAAPLLVAYTDYPPDFVREYSSGGYHFIDPTAMDSFGLYGITYWEDSLKRHGKPDDLKSLLLDFNLKDAAAGRGYGCGIRNTRNDEKGIIAFSGLSRRERHETVLSLVSPHIHEAMSRIMGRSLQGAFGLSPREREILQWLTHGKSTWDISVILRISERTVKFHIDNVMKKLDAVNRTHAVAIALREGLIELS